jgi:hypothetical protein
MQMGLNGTTKRDYKEGGLNIKSTKKQYLFAFKLEQTSGLTITLLGFKRLMITFIF